jgi:hypothetical protein
MKLAYLSTDELNRELVRGWAGRQGVGVTCPVRVDQAPEEAFDAVLLDLDHLPADRLADLLDRLSATRRFCLVAAHGYGTSRPDLGGRPVAVHERLRRGSSATSPVPYGKHLANNGLARGESPLLQITY